MAAPAGGAAQRTGRHGERRRAGPGPGGRGPVPAQGPPRVGSGDAGRAGRDRAGRRAVAVRGELPAGGRGTAAGAPRARLPAARVGRPGRGGRADQPDRVPPAAARPGRPGGGPRGRVRAGAPQVAPRRRGYRPGGAARRGRRIPRGRGAGAQRRPGHARPGTEPGRDGLGRRTDKHPAADGLPGRVPRGDGPAVRGHRAGPGPPAPAPASPPRCCGSGSSCWLRRYPPTWGWRSP